MDKNIIFAKIADIMSYYDMTQKEFCKRIGVAENTLSTWKARGNWDVSKIAAAFPEIMTDWLIHDRGPMFESDEASLHDQSLAFLDIDEDALRVAHDYMSNRDKCTPARAYEDTEPAISTVHEPTATSTAPSMDMITIPRAVLNALTQQLDVKDAQISTLLTELSRLRMK